jgi:hypothetical protein
MGPAHVPAHSLSSGDFRIEIPSSEVTTSNKIGLG